MWKDTEYFKNKGGECHTHWDTFRGVALRLEAPMRHFFPNQFSSVSRSAPLGCVPAVAAGGGHSGHRDDPGRQDPHGHLLSEPSALVSNSCVWLSSLPAAQCSGEELQGRGGEGEREMGLPSGAVLNSYHIHPSPTPPSCLPGLPQDHPPLFSPHSYSTEAGPDFKLRLELYGACMEEEGALAGAPKRLATKLSSSLGRSSGRRVRASLESAGGSGSSPVLLPTPAVR